MNQIRNLVLALSVLGLGGSGLRESARPVFAPELAPPPTRALPYVAPVTAMPVSAAPASVSPASSGWVAEKDKNICGIDDLDKVSNPAKVDYPDLMAATPQMKRIEKDGIDPESPQGKVLRQEAVRLITKTCEIVRRRKGHCGIWKEISHRDGRKIPDVTSDVRDEID